MFGGKPEVPAPLLNASIECDSLQERIINRWTDREEEKNYYWLSSTHSSQNGVPDTLHTKLLAYLRTNSTLPDAFNRSFDFDEEIPAEYDYYLRVEDSGLSGKEIELSYKGRRSGYYYWEPDTGCYKSTRFILSLDENYDRYLKSSIVNDDYLSAMDSEPLFYAPLWTYSNIHGGTGLVASYSKYEDALDSFKYPRNGRSDKMKRIFFIFSILNGVVFTSFAQNVTLSGYTGRLQDNRRTIGKCHDR